MSDTFTARVTDFERAPWLPVTDLAKELDWAARQCAMAVERDWLDQAKRDAHDVALMRGEDMRVGDAYRAAYQARKAAAS